METVKVIVLVVIMIMSGGLKESLMADTVKRFQADQEAQKELEELREKMADMEKMMKIMVELPGFDKLVEEAAKRSSI